jgi:bifunctional pyridoxal-dependent enzyme with beta-cystathionase and maltose regulon repressor activities
MIASQAAYAGGEEWLDQLRRISMATMITESFFNQTSGNKYAKAATYLA